MASQSQLKKDIAKAKEMKANYLKRSKGNKNNDYVRGFGNEVAKLQRQLRTQMASSASKKMDTKKKK